MLLLNCEKSLRIIQIFAEPADKINRQIFVCIGKVGILRTGDIFSADMTVHKRGIGFTVVTEVHIRRGVVRNAFPIADRRRNDVCFNGLAGSIIELNCIGKRNGSRSLLHLRNFCDGSDMIIAVNEFTAQKFVIAIPA